MIRSEPASSPLRASRDRHPPGLYALFFTEMWERMSYYGMRALLFLFMIAPVEDGGMGMKTKVAASIYGLYTAGVYLAALPGGWVADRLLGAQRAVWWGGILIAAGHFTLVIPRRETFFAGLVLIVLGTGLLKPNVSALVGHLYPEGGPTRDAGFTLFYMGINLGAFIGPLVCGALGQKVHWHLGFAAAGVGMIAGLVQFYFTRVHLGSAGVLPIPPEGAVRRDWTIVAGGASALALVVILGIAGVVQFDPVRLADHAARAIVGMAVVYFIWILAFSRLSPPEIKRVVVIAVLFVASVWFWAGYEQMGSSLSLFADRFTHRVIPLINIDMPSSWFQALPALFVILFAPGIAWLWLRSAQRGIAPSIAVKFAASFFLLASGFVVMTIGAHRALQSGPVWPTWLIATFLLHTLGELCLSPVGLSSVTKLAPPRLVGQMMGIWFLGSSLGNLLAGRLAGDITGENAAAMPGHFWGLVLSAAAAGLVLICLVKPIRNLMGGVQ